MAEIEEETGIPNNKVSASPTRQFFVSMLTRDIDLLDAVMDLVDNCVDGVHRHHKADEGDNHPSNIYNGFHVDITLNESEFKMVDNCGGIPVHVAKEYAFKMGRSPDYHDDDDVQTVGMYGIGMKRSIFKIGLEADVISWNENDRFKVTIPKDWVELEGDWYFDFEDLTEEAIAAILPRQGTLISIKSLKPNISKQFVPNGPFTRKLEIDLSNHYGYIIQQGFKIRLNGNEIRPIEINILTTDGLGEKPIKPYVYADYVDDVSIEIIIGFYRPFATEEEIDRELEGLPISSSQNAGITILCNDRVVLNADKTFLSGWGENPIPKYHTQFINIAGVVHFRSNIPINLPVTTTKRGLDTSSELYSIAKIRIKEGLKYFTSITNYWKTPSEQRSQLFANPKRVNALAPGFTNDPQNKDTLTLTKAKRNDNGLYQIPDLPKPEISREIKEVTIKFSRSISKVEKAADYYFGNKSKPANEVGAWCFDKMFTQIESED